MCAIASDTYPDRPWSAALALRLPHRVQQALAHTFQRAIGAAKVLEIAGQGILRVLVLAAATLQHKLYFDVVLLPLIEVNHRRLDTQVVAAILSRDRIDRIRPQLSAPGRLGYRGPYRFLDRNLADADWRVHEKRRHTRVLADWTLIRLRHVNVRRDDVE